MNINSLRYVLKIAEEKNITRAANTLFISQSALSQNLQSIESEVGASLFDRTSSPLIPSEAGIMFIDWATRVIESQNQLMSMIKDITNNPRRTLKIGLSPQKSIQIFPEIIKNFYSTNSACQIILEEHPSDKLLDMLEHNEIDILYDVNHSDNINFSFIPIAIEKMFIAIPNTYSVPNMPNQPYPTIELDDIMEFPVISLSQKQYLGKIIRSLFKHGNRIPNISMECRSADMALKMVSMGIGLTVVPEFALKKNHFKNINIYELNHPELTRQVGISYIKENYISNDISLFIRLTKKYLGTD